MKAPTVVRAGHPFDSGLSIEQQRGTDLTTDVGVLHLTDHRVTDSSVLSAIPTERARCVVVALAASAAAGTVRRCVEMAVDFIRTREQFGKPSGPSRRCNTKPLCCW